MIKLLTGQAIHEAIQQYSPMMDWTDLPIKVQENYNQMAKSLNQQLGICEECGERPQDGILHEVAGDMNCTACITPPLDDPNVQYMHFYENEDGSLAGVVTPPAGMSLEAYKQQLQEEMKNINFTLCFLASAGDPVTVYPQSFAELHEAMKTHLPMPFDDRGYPYYIRVKKGQEFIGMGHYIRKHTEIIVRSETGAALGLNDALYEYAFNHKA